MADNNLEINGMLPGWILKLLGAGVIALVTAVLINTVSIQVIQGNRYTAKDAVSQQQINDATHLQLIRDLGLIKEALARIEGELKVR